MGDILVLKDNVRSDPFSKINNFTYEWIKWSHFIKMAPLDYIFNNDDIIIVNFNDSDDPYKNYSINKKCRKIGIVHQINLVNLSLLNDCVYLIYMNPLMQQIALNHGITRPHTVFNKYPEYDFNNVELNRSNQTFIGGWLDTPDINSIKAQLVNAYELSPQNNNLVIGFCYGRSDIKKKLIRQSIDDLIHDKYISGNRMILNDTVLTLSMLLFHMRTSTHAYLYSTYPSMELITDLLHSKSNDILNYKVSESSMLSLAKSAKLNILCDTNLVNYNSLDDTNIFTYKMFSNDIAHILKKY